jgi:hypothetical protein
MELKDFMGGVEIGGFDMNPLHGVESHHYPTTELPPIPVYKESITWS